MGLFSKNKKEEIPETTDLPELPKLPDLPSNNQFKPKVNMLPRFPSNPLGDKFSQNTIKDAVSGEKEDEEDADESEEEIQTMPKLPDVPLVKEDDEISRESTFSSKQMPITQNHSINIQGMQQSSQPIFVRLDKFEENLEIFDKIKKQFSGIEKLLDGIKQTKEQENKELDLWQQKLQTMKDQIDKIDRDIFSKI